jgi:hypothetical protein
MPNSKAMSGVPSVSLSLIMSSMQNLTFTRTFLEVFATV